MTQFRNVILAMGFSAALMLAVPSPALPCLGGDGGSCGARDGGSSCNRVSVQQSAGLASCCGSSAETDTTAARAGSVSTSCCEADDTCASTNDEQHSCPGKSGSGCQGPCECPPGCPAPCGAGKLPCPPIDLAVPAIELTPAGVQCCPADGVPSDAYAGGVFHPPRF